MIYAIIILVLLGLGINKLSEKYAFTRLSYHREVSKTIVEREEFFEITSIIENKKLIPVTFLQVVEKFPASFEFQGKVDINRGSEGLYHTLTMTLMPYQRIRRRYKVFCNKRGRHIIYECTMNVGDILGINTFRRGIVETTEVIVLPRRYDISRNLSSYGNYNGDISVRRWIIEDPILTIGIREYTGLEPQKNIHWPSSLKNGRLMVKNFDYTADNRVMVALNIEAYKPFWIKIDHEKIEKCISITRTVIEGFEEEGIQYGFTTNAQASGGLDSKINILPGWGSSHLFNIVECLGRIDYGISMEFEEQLEAILRRNETYSTLVIITPRVLENYTEYLNALNRMCERLIVISLDEENLDMLDPGIISYVEREVRE